MAFRRTNLEAGLLTAGPDAGKVLVIEGNEGSSLGVSLSSCELFDPANETFSAADPMAESRLEFPAVVLGGGDVLVFGGACARRPTPCSARSSATTPRRARGPR